MKKLVIATDNYLPRWDGISRFLSEIIPKLTKEYEITVIAPDNGKTKEKGFKVIKIPVKKMLIGDFHPAKFKYFKISRIIKNADIIFTQTIGPIGISAIISAKRHRKTLVSFIHSIEWELFPKAVSTPLLKKILYPISKKLVRFLYNKCNMLIVPSDNISDKLRWQNIVTRKEIAHLGVETDKFIKGNKESAKKKLRINPKNIVIGYHGRLGREKDLKTLMRAFVRVRKDNENVKLLIVGSGVKEVENLFKNQEDVKFVGQKDDVVPYIQAMDIYVLPSLTETSSLSTLEAMSCEVAVIATPVGFVNDYIQDGKNGLFFQKQHPFMLAKKIQKLIDNPILRGKLGVKGRRTVVKGFIWKITAERIAKAMNSISK